MLFIQLVKMFTTACNSLREVQLVISLCYSRFRYVCSSVQRLASLVRDGLFVEAIQLGLELYEGKAPAVVGKWYIYIIYI